MDFSTSLEFDGRYPAKMACQNGGTIEYSAPVEFGGDKGPITPEDAFVGAANMCFQIVFRNVAEGLGMRVQGYRCRAVGDLETVDGLRKFIKIDLYPEIRFAEGSRVENLQKAIEATKKRCLVTNSMNCLVNVEPRVL